jgi:hypothetical protein
VRYGFPHEAGRDIWEIVDAESAGREDEGRVVLNVIYDDP